MKVLIKNLRVSLTGLKKFLKMSEIEELVKDFGTIKIKNRGTGAGVLKQTQMVNLLKKPRIMKCA
jgi:hypothetical protein